MPPTVAPRALPRRSTIVVELTPSELHKLVRVIETEAEQAMADEQIDFADFLFLRIASLREAAR